MVNGRAYKVPEEPLRTRRLRLGLTQAELAERLGVRANTLARWERGELAPRRPEHITGLLSQLETSGHRETQRTTPAGRVSRSPATPNPLTSFVGRERETARGLQLLSEHRLVTIVGPGGVGKTRLALRVANEFANDTGRGLIFVSLASVSDPGLVLPTVAQAAGVLDSPTWKHRTSTR